MRLEPLCDGGEPSRRVDATAGMLNWVLESIEPEERSARSPGMFHQFLLANRDAIIARARAKVATRLAPRATAEELESGIPLFLDQLTDSVRLSLASSLAMDASATRHGGDLLKRGFTVAQVVHDYGGVCQAVTELAHESKAPITADEFHTFNRCLDDAIAHAVTEYTRQREQSITETGTERLGDLAHELRNSVSAAMMSFQILRTGSVGLSGSTAALHDVSLRRLSNLIDSALGLVRLESGVRAAQRLALRDFVEEVEVGATMEANARGLTLAVAPVEPDVEVVVDRQLLAAAVTNLLQNAFKFTRPQGHVSLKTTSTQDRVLLEVEDECGGLPPGKVEELFRPFEQRSANRTGLGLGLSNLSQERRGQRRRAACAGRPRGRLRLYDRSAAALTGALTERSCGRRRNHRNGAIQPAFAHCVSTAREFEVPRRAVGASVASWIQEVKMSVIVWIILGLVSGFIASKIVNKTGEGAVLDIVLGIVGAVVGGFLFQLIGATGVSGFNIWSMFVATIGAIVVLSVKRALLGRGRLHA